VDADRLRVWLMGLGVVLGSAAVLWLLWRLLSAVAPAVTVTAVGGLVAVLLLPVADFLQRAVRSRPLAALAVVLLLLAPFVLLVGVLFTVVLHEAQGLLRHLPAQLATADLWAAHLQSYLAVHLHLHLDLTSRLAAAGHGKGVGAGLTSSLTSALTSAGGNVLKDSIGIVSDLATVTTDTVLVLVVAFFLVWDGRAIVSAAFDLLPDAWRPHAREVGHILFQVLAAYFRGQVIVGALFGLIIGGGMALLGLPDPALLGFLAGLFEMVPTVGPILASIGPLVLSLGQPYPHVLYVLAWLVLAQQVESNLLVPRISGGVVGLHPLTVILGVFAGWSVAGLAGAFLAVPAAAVGREAIRRWWRPPVLVPTARPRRRTWDRLAGLLAWRGPPRRRPSPPSPATGRRGDEDAS
jgi:predicted PurR-regulated permease PerM